MKIAAVDLVIGYETYLQLITELLKDKKVLGYRMTEEVELGESGYRTYQTRFESGSYQRRKSWCYGMAWSDC